MSSRRQRRRISQKNATSQASPNQEAGRSPSQPSKAGKWILRGLVLLAILLIGGLLLAYSSLRKYLNGNDFNQLITQQVGKLLHADLTLAPLQWDGWQVRSSSLEGTGMGTLQSLTAQNIDTELDLGGLREKKWKLDSLNIREINLIASSLKKELSEKLAKEEPSSTNSKESGNFFSSWLPNKTEIQHIRIGKFSGHWEHPSGLTTWKRISLTATADPNQNNSHHYDLLFKGGHLTTPLKLLPQAELRQATARLNGSDLYLKEAQFDVLSNGQLLLSGEKSKTDYSLEGELNHVTAAEVIPKKWSRHLAGDLQTDFELTGKSNDTPILEGHLTLRNGVLSQLPFLDRLAAYADTTRFRQLQLSTAELDYKKQGDRIQISNLNLASEGLVRLTGTVDLNGKKIDARLRLGLTPGTLANIPGAETKVFLPGEDNLLWTDLHLTGTLDDLNEDLSDRLLAAAVDRMFELAPETGLYVLKHSGRLAGESAQTLLKESGKLAEVGSAIAAEVAQKAAEIAPEVIEKGIDTAAKAGESATDAAEKAIDLGQDLGKGILNGILSPLK